MRAVTNVPVEVVLAALEARAEPAAVLRGGEVMAANPAALALGDAAALADLARRSSEEAVLLEAGERSIEVRASAVGDLTVLIGSDVTRREEVRRQQARSDEILRLGAHELRNPLHVVGMICHLLETRAGRGEPLDKGTLDRLRRQMERLDRLITQLLELSRIQDGRMSLDTADGDLAALARAQVALVDARRAPDVSATLVESAPVRGDLTRLTEVVRQLVDNAVRFTDAGTPIAVRLGRDPESDGWLLTVEDRGHGIAPAERASLFQRHVRIDRSRGPQGLGLGLYIASYVARLHGGTLAHEPVSPTGARFLLRLPRRAASTDAR
jgi:signal transduction histidine kinase